MEVEDNDETGINIYDDNLDDNNLGSNGSSSDSDDGYDYDSYEMRIEFAPILGSKLELNNTQIAIGFVSYIYDIK
ncbi:8584_t:CDS:2 [Entrophospora sp. SA101]|nr:8584_t:CDS:2 [Entrophospora sp. SA101]